MNASADVLDRPVDAEARNTRPRFSGPDRGLNRRSRRARAKRCKARSTTTRDERGKGGLFLNNRHYDPTTGTFLSVDPLVTKTMQPYLYGGANPATYSDPSGLDPDTRADVRAEAERRGGCTYSSTNAACEGRPRVHGPTQWTPRRTIKANTYGPDGTYYTEDTVFYDSPAELDLSGRRAAGNPHRTRVMRNGEYYVGGYLDSSQEHDLSGAVEGRAGFGIGITACLLVCVQFGGHQGEGYLSVGGLGVGATVDGRISSQTDPCAQEGWSHGGSYVVGVGGGGSVATPLPDGGGWWGLEGDNFNVTGSVGLLAKGSLPFAGGSSHTWVTGC